jgi:Fe-S cluster assembly ATP-binding protein
MATLEIRDLHVTVASEQGDKEILRGVDLTVRSGATHAIMGPNGSGKSTLAYSVAGHPKYTVTRGTVRLDGEDVLAMSRRRARPRRAVPRHAVPGRDPRRHRVELPAHRQDRDRRRGPQAAHLGQGRPRRDGRPAHRPHVRRAQRQRGLLGGEKKRHEILQLELLKPKFAVLDETDSGLDVDALRIVSEGVNRVRATGEVGVLLITHYTRILRYIRPTSCTSSSTAASSRRAGPSSPSSSRPRATTASRARRAPAASPAGA